MKTQQQVESKVTPEIIKKIKSLHDCNCCLMDDECMDCSYFPLLIHRAVEGWNKLNEKLYIEVDHSVWFYGEKEIIEYDPNKYKPTTLTACELALLDCLVDVLSGEGI